MSKIIEDNLLSISNAMFKNKKDWVYVTDKQKDTYFFIINRLLSKKYLKQSYLLNNKNVDKVSCMNIWYNFMLDKPYPKFIWSKQEKQKEKLKISNNDFELLLKKLQISNHDLNYLIENNLDFIKEQLKFYKELEK